MQKDSETRVKTLKVSYDVITTIVRCTISEIDGVEGLGKTSVTFGELFMKPQNAPIRVKISNDGVAEITISIEVLYGKRITSLSEKIQNEVKANVQSMTGITVSRVNVIVTGVVFPSKN